MQIVPEIQLDKQHFLKQKQKATQQNNKNFWLHKECNEENELF